MSAPPGWVVPPQWKRRWGVTMKRWGLAWCVIFPLVSFAGYFGADHYWPIHGYSETATNMGAELAGYMLGYLVWFAWWLDHLLARFGARTVLISHAAAAAMLDVIATGSNSGNAMPWLPAWYLPVISLVVTPLAYLFAQRVKDSFAPTSAPTSTVDAGPWAPPPL